MEICSDEMIGSWLPISIYKLFKLGSHVAYLVNKPTFQAPKISSKVNHRRPMLSYGTVESKCLWTDRVTREFNLNCSLTVCVVEWISNVQIWVLNYESITISLSEIWPCINQGSIYYIFYKIILWLEILFWKLNYVFYTGLNLTHWT